MGFYDNCCMVTGVSLKGSDAALVLLERRKAAYRPAALAVKGAYDRLGSIDGIDHRDANCRLIYDYFSGKVKSGELAVDEAEMRAVGRWPVKNLEAVLWAFERNMNDGGQHHLNGRPIVFALICRAVWDALAQTADARAKTPSAQFAELFKDSAIADEIYKSSLTKVAAHLRELHAVCGFLAQQRIKWQPAEADSGQHYGEEMREFLQEARRRFKKSAVVLEALKDYEKEVADCLAD